HRHPHRGVRYPLRARRLAPAPGGEPMPQTVTDVVKALTAQEKAAIGRLVDWLRIPSVSTDPAHTQDCVKAAEWAAARLGEACIDASLRPTGTPDSPGHPIVWAHHAGPDGYQGPHVLFYGHYDV